MKQYPILQALLYSKVGLTSPTCGQYSVCGLRGTCVCTNEAQPNIEPFHTPKKSKIMENHQRQSGSGKKCCVEVNVMSIDPYHIHVHNYMLKLNH